MPRASLAADQQTPPPCPSSNETRRRPLRRVASPTAASFCAIDGCEGNAVLSNRFVAVKMYIDEEKQIRKKRRLYKSQRTRSPILPALHFFSISFKHFIIKLIIIGKVNTYNIKISIMSAQKFNVSQVLAKLKCSYPPKCAPLAYESSRQSCPAFGANTRNGSYDR